MSSFFHRTNSWHWLAMSVASSALLVAYPCHLVRKKTSGEDGPKLQAMEAHAEELKLLREEDVLLLEHQAAEIRKRIAAYEAVVREKVGQSIPEGEQSALSSRNEINRALLAHHLRIVEQVQEDSPETEGPTVPAVPPAAMPDAAIAPELQDPGPAVEVPVAAQAPEKPPLFTTREVRYVVEGEYRHMFMFLVRQSHRKPPYHFKDIKIKPSSQPFVMRMEFTLQLNFT